MRKNDKVLVLGARGLVGSGFCRYLEREGYSEVIQSQRTDLDLLDQLSVRSFFQKVKPDYVLMAAGRVGGIVANSTYPWDFIYDNTVMAANVLDSCRRFSTKKVLMLGSTCIYPRLAPQPIKEESLLAGPLEATNEWYAVAKIAGIKMGQALRRQHGLSVIAAMPTNLYGPNDNYHPINSHVLPALIRRFHEAKLRGDEQVLIWGTGKPRREFLHVDDLSRALELLLRVYDEDSIVNVGCGEDVTISELAHTVGAAVGFEGRIEYDTSKPDGTPQKKTDGSKLAALGWTPRIGLAEGLADAYKWFLEHAADPVPAKP